MSNYSPLLNYCKNLFFFSFLKCTLWLLKLQSHEGQIYILHLYRGRKNKYFQFSRKWGQIGQLPITTKKNSLYLAQSQLSIRHKLGIIYDFYGDLYILIYNSRQRHLRLCKLFFSDLLRLDKQENWSNTYFIFLPLYKFKIKKKTTFKAL